ncbi:methylated-DNA--[protein]-cysteine S-methyltransferase [Siccirubricoccus sp. KC 17139]|uniref:Methylated-DNA--protein-cysteine methyltransferase n=1 Tax=Siccirubricoccus soli TaxID=2899147 RepID=A0ABT1D1W3_9PROT|nr:methylated-DNA--[protein]-cysteine S-methyltransferase [Siccirubricoccus soli]MCO6415300.1 methylated-DNA--[protein]-cysteine S-methyltransferase [Siccirubricoccus soli]MCP2681431.1 methylated-DNA--[protein]-cysteine S-methyltransferase [Siccirubricoccus soli]
MPHISLHTPIGELTVFEAEGSIVALDWGRAQAGEITPLLQRAADQLQDYFDGLRTGFDLPLAPEGTAFRRKVWAALTRIPPGQTRSYLDIAREVGCLSPRAIGQANGANPIPILIPCHRVIAHGGGIGGYSGGEGLATKRFLLALEARAVSQHNADPLPLFGRSPPPAAEGH